MPDRVPTHRPTRFTPTARQPAATVAETRPSAARRGYGRRWREQTRDAQLAREPLCRLCRLEDGRDEPATDVDHIVPRRRGGSDMPDNLQSLCKPHHQRKTAGGN